MMPPNLLQTSLQEERTYGRTEAATEIALQHMRVEAGRVSGKSSLFGAPESLTEFPDREGRPNLFSAARFLARRSFRRLFFLAPPATAVATVAELALLRQALLESLHNIDHRRDVRSPAWPLLFWPATLASIIFCRLRR